jgi:hypothetical protein
MKFSSMRSAIVIASVVAGSVIPSQAFAQIDVFNAVNVLEYDQSGTSISTYRFNSSMILNSIDFGTAYFSNGNTIYFNNLILSYQVGTVAYQTVDNSLLGTVDAKGYQRIYLGELNVAADTDVRVRIQGNHRIGNQYGVNSASNVSYLGNNSPGLGDRGDMTNSNIRVYNPGSTVPGASVAPEPGTFALALTGGAALIGVCIRRRRNAA